MKSKKSLALLLAATASASLLAGCGPKPEEQVQKSLEHQNTTKSSSAKMYLEATPETWMSFVGTSWGSAKDGGKTITEQDKKTAKALMEMSITYEASTKDGSPLAEVQDPTNLNYGFFLDDKTKNLLSLLGTNENLFLRADLKEFALLTGYSTPAQLDETKKSVNSPILTSLVDGKWLGLDQELAKSFTDEVRKSALKAGSGDLTKEEAKQVNTAMRSSFMRASTFKKEGDWTVATVAVKQVLNDYKSEVEKVQQGKETADATASLKKLVDATKDDARLNVYLRYEGETLKQAKVNLAEVANSVDYAKLNPDTKEAPELVKNLQAHPLNLVVDLSDEVKRLQAPGDYTKVTQKDLNGLMGGGY